MLIFGHDTVFSITVASTRTRSLLKNTGRKYHLLITYILCLLVKRFRGRSDTEVTHPAIKSPDPHELQGHQGRRRDICQVVGFVVQKQKPQGVVCGTAK